MNTPKFSIVIRAKNEAKSLPKLLKKIKTQTLQDYEIVLVDDHSSDETVKIAQEYNGIIVNLDQKFTYGGSLNVGVNHSRGTYIISIAAHAEPITNQWLAAYLECMESDSKIAAVYGKQVAGPGANLVERFERFANSHFDYNLYQPYFLNTNGCFRKSVWEQIKFDELVWGLEDHVWSRKVVKLGYKLGYCAGASVYHHHDKNTLATIIRYYREGKVYAGLLMGRYK